MTSSVLGAPREDILPGRKKRTGFFLKKKKRKTTNERAISLGTLVSAQQHSHAECAAHAETKAVITAAFTFIRGSSIRCTSKNKTHGPCVLYEKLISPKNGQIHGYISIFY